MDWETPKLMVDPYDGEETALRRASDDSVVQHVPPDFRGLDSLWVVQRLFNLSAHNPALRVIPLQVPDVRWVPDNWAVVHPYIEYIQQVEHPPYSRSLRASSLQHRCTFRHTHTVFL